MKCDHEVIVEVKDADPIAATDTDSAGQLDRSVTIPDLHAGR